MNKIVRSFVGKLRFGLVIVISASFISGCGGSSSGDDTSADNDCTTVAGRLITDEIVSAVGCGWEDHTESQVYVVTQNKCELSVTTNAGLFSGLADGSGLSWSAEFPYETGTMTITALNIKVSGDSVEGTTSWSWSDGVNDCSGGNEISGKFQAAAIVTQPQPPSSLDSRAITSRLINLSWEDNSNNETGFVIERSDESGSSGYEEIVTVAANVGFYDDFSLNASTQYWYRVFAKNSAGISAYSNVVPATSLDPPAPVPLAPSSLVASATSSESINLTWTDQSSHEDGFAIERRNITRLSSFEEIATVAVDVASFDDFGLDAETEYLYRVRAFNSAGYSSYSNANGDTTLPPPITIPLSPSSLVATQTSSSSISLLWSDISSDENGFFIERSSESDIAGFEEIATVAADIVSYEDQGLEESTQYWYRMTAFNSAGISNYSNVDNAVTPAFDPQCDLPANCQFQIGAGIYDITGPAAELGMMGYSDAFQRTLGIHTRLYSRAFVMGDAVGDKKVVYVSADLLAISNPVRRGVMEKLHAAFGNLYTNDNVMLSATHTHSGPGGYTGATMYDLAILGFDKQNYNAIVEGIYQSIVRAHNNVGPGKIKINKGDIEGAGFNRSVIPYEQNPDKIDYTDNYDKEMVLLRMERPDGTEIGMINWHAVHPTSIGKENHLISSDNKGYAAFYFEKSRGADYLSAQTFVGAFAQSNAGDVSPNLWGYPAKADYFSNMEIIGGRLLNKANELYDQADDYLMGEVDYRHKYLDLSKNGNLVSDGKTCVAAIGLSIIGGSSEDGIGLDIDEGSFIFGINWPNFTLFPEDQACHEGKVVLLPTGRLLPYPWTPDVLPVQILRIGNLALVGLPFEATTMTGRRMRNAVHNELDDIGVEHVVFAGYANDYSGYITTAEEYALQHYEGASTLFGPDSEQVLREEVVKLAKNMRDDNSPPTSANPPDVRRSTISFILGVIFDDKPLFKSFGSVHKNSDASYNRGQTAKIVFWGAHPKNNLRSQDTFIEIQKKAGSSWITVLRDNDPTTRYIWRRNFIAYSLVTIEWDISMNTDPGTYRIIHHGNWKNGWTGSISEYSGQSREFSVN